MGGKGWKDFCHQLRSLLTFVVDSVAVVSLAAFVAVTMETVLEAEIVYFLVGFPVAVIAVAVAEDKENLNLKNVYLREFHIYYLILGCIRIELLEIYT